MTGETLRRTPLHPVHADLDAKLVPFAGWEMPLHYGAIVDEHHVVRKAAGLFDLGHMGRLYIGGPDRVALLDSLVTNQVRDLEVGRARYALVLNERGTVLDDVIYYVLDDEILLVVNGANREKIVAWLGERLPASGLDARFEDRTFAQTMVALQGPRAAEVLAAHTDVDLAGMRYYRCAAGEVLGMPALVARTGYTGEDGFEVYFDAARAADMWNGLLEAGAGAGVKPCGLGARDTLRTEAAMALYGHEIDEETNPLEAGLDFAVKLDKGEFVGRAALQAIADGGGPARKLRGFFVEGRRIPRPEYEVFRAGAPEGAAAVGRVTSGTHSPTLGRPICIAMIDAKVGDDEALAVDIRGSRSALEPTALPFYKRPKKKG